MHVAACLSGVVVRSARELGMVQHSGSVTVRKMTGSHPNGRQHDQTALRAQAACRSSPAELLHPQLVARLKYTTRRRVNHDGVQ